MKRSKGIDLSSVAWRKSSYSNGQGADCLEVADNLPGITPVRDSKNPNGPALVFPAHAWGAFVGTLKDGAALDVSDS
ncbi:DUF397 domain-containing protein [Streptomyces sp. DT2A-34]|uniref:DUF397 domain-containing protein n=1 Tax=Streptomyces sp. DT2A-34 TaxID=3051182 RepID=UPI00265C6151|nr:DUF397 domain-containing protein [Streptomyces sp. DT2A-34]MDO0912357.1 DUF397 domain-containing protein [Streptomyces sp. DT2A-34]